MDVSEILEEARRAGIDLDLLDIHLALSAEERVRRHEAALQLKLALREAGRALTHARPGVIVEETQ